MRTISDSHIPPNTENHDIVKGLKTQTDVSKFSLTQNEKKRTEKKLYIHI